MGASDKANAVASDPDMRGTWIIGMAAVAVLVVVGVVFRNQ